MSSDEKKFTTQELSKEELAVFNADLKALNEKHGTTLVANPFISEGKINAGLVAVKIIEVKDSVESPLPEYAGDNSNTSEENKA